MILLAGYFEVQDSPEFESDFSHLPKSENNNWYDTLELDERFWTVELIRKGDEVYPSLYQITKRQMIQNQEAIQAILDNEHARAYGKLTTLLNHAHQVGLINTNQLRELDANLDQLRLGNNSCNIKL